MDFDPSAWYTLDTVASNGTRALSLCQNQSICLSDINLTEDSAQWQLVAFGARPSSTTSSPTATSSASPSQFTISVVSIRNKALGQNSAVAVSQSGNQTLAVMRPLSGNSQNQLWNFVYIPNTGSGDPYWYIKNLNNGTAFNLAATSESVNMTQVLYFASPNQAWTITKVTDTPSTNSTSNPPATSSSATGGSNDTQGDDKLSGGAIAGIVIGVLFGLALLAGLLFILARRRRRQKQWRPRISNPIPIPPESQTNDSASPTLVSTMKDSVTEPAMEPLMEKEKEQETGPEKDQETVDGRVELPSERDQRPFQRHELA